MLERNDAVDARLPRVRKLELDPRCPGLSGTIILLRPCFPMGML